eukprot:scaffold2708_cov54-Attheya_sp.AAC.2
MSLIVVVLKLVAVWESDGWLSMYCMHRLLLHGAVPSRGSLSFSRLALCRIAFWTRWQFLARSIS